MGRHLCLINGGVADPGPVPVADADPWLFQDACALAFRATWVVRGFAPSTIRSSTSLLARVLARFDRPVWGIGPEDVDGMVRDLVARRRAPGTRRLYVQALRSFLEFLRERHQTDIYTRFGVLVGSPVDRFNRARHTTDGSPSVGVPPTVERVAAFFAFARDRVAVAADYRAAARDYAVLRTLYLAGVRVSELVRLDRCDVHLAQGTSGRLHVRFGKAANASGPRPRFTPMLDGLDQVLAWYLADVRPLFPGTATLFPDPDGAPLKPETVRDRLARLLDLEARPTSERFAPHALRRACATHNYERGMDLVAVQHLLGHRHIASTMAYVKPSARFVEGAWQRATATAVTALAG
ncbi:MULTISPECIES: site-specific integrase [unclassified Kitasatospora]|uniref:tyrosine-type recombinase/integrase n=1 Tax=unclassified Kitasatospora TaxID=2633591 RepID=UPI0033DD30E7